MIDDADSIDGIDFDAYPIEAEEKTRKLRRSVAKMMKQTPHKRTASPEESPVDVSDSSKRLETLLSGTPCDTF